MSRVAQAPYKRSFSYTNEVEEEDDISVRILGLAYSTDPKEASFAAVIDQDGAVVEYQRLPNFFLKRINNDNHPKVAASHCH